MTYGILSIPLHHCQGGPPPSTLSSRLERSGGEGPAVPLQHCQGEATTLRFVILPEAQCRGGTCPGLANTVKVGLTLRFVIRGLERSGGEGPAVSPSGAANVTWAIIYGPHTNSPTHLVIWFISR